MIKRKTRKKIKKFLDIKNVCQKRYGLLSHKRETTNILLTDRCNTKRYRRAVDAILDCHKRTNSPGEITPTV